MTLFSMEEIITQQRFLVKPVCQALLAEVASYPRRYYVPSVSSWSSQTRHLAAYSTYSRQVPKHLLGPGTFLHAVIPLSQPFG
ncbi:hypothetical protein [Synechococcus sp. M16CYN]|uniref:hypothetical protein n=1 Tax=Synechococcus sp. M16CYN TaxID=3103139 RepID=UPI0033409B97